MEKNEIDFCDMKNQRKSPARSRGPWSDLELYICIKNYKVYLRDTVPLSTRTYMRSGSLGDPQKLDVDLYASGFSLVCSLSIE
jgi:hypothetical protein